MATTKESLIEWLSELPDDIEIGIEVGRSGELSLLAISGTEMYLLAVGNIPANNDSAESNGHRRS